MHRIFNVPKKMQTEKKKEMLESLCANFFICIYLCRATAAAAAAALISGYLHPELRRMENKEKNGTNIWLKVFVCERED